LADFSFVEWSAVWAGALTAAALSFVFLTFGATIGLSVISPWPASGVSAKTFSALAVFWTVAQQIGAFLAGGYIAGRMRARWAEVNKDEVEFRDGLHGALVWAIGIIVGAVMLVATAGAVAKTGSEAATKTVSAAASNADSIAYYSDVLLRPVPRPAAATGQAAPRVEPVSPDTRAEVVRIFTRAIAAGSLSDSDRAYLGTLVAQRTGMPQQDAEKRVSDQFAETSRVLRETADKARKGGILTGFVAAASLLISLAAAWWAAQRGGHHRDNAIPASLVAFGTSLRRLQ
jgi:hypothetical protein